MAVYGDGTKYGSGAKYGWDVTPGSPTDILRKVYGGVAPWLPTNVTPLRERCPEINGDGGTIAGLTTGSERQIRAGDALLPEDTLSLEFADPAGDYSGAGGVLARDSLITLAWATTTLAGGTLTRDDQQYRVVAAPSMQRVGRERATLHVTAEDWLRAPLTQPLGSYGGGGVPSPAAQVLESPLRWAIRVTGASTWLGVIQGLWTQLGASLTLDSSAGDGGAVPTGAALDTFVDWLGGGAWPSYRQVLESLQATFGIRSTYGRSIGTVDLLGSDARVSSGFVVSCDASQGGAFPIPWERYGRTLQRPQYSRVEVWYAWLDDAHPPVAHQVLAAGVSSTHPTNTDSAPFARTEYLTSNVPIASAIGGSVYDTAASVAKRRLQGYIGAADRITLTVDSAMPLPRIYDELTLAVPDDALTGVWALVGATMPLGTGQGTLDLEWRGRS